MTVESFRKDADCVVAFLTASQFGEFAEAKKMFAGCDDVEALCWGMSGVIGGLVAALAKFVDQPPAKRELRAVAAREAAS